ncbi:hypothetical protein, partial [Winogradskyella sp.]|uniref:hypothetical protein n=1 Tax=Winogradskyella sp. TaxID=1883156 RepID=UPI002635D311
SKTIFINHILQCWGMDYIIRFTAPDSGDYKHVYTVAIVNGEEVPVDSVYYLFGYEESYYKKKDYDMTKISMIRGLKGYHNVGTADDPSMEELTEMAAEISADKMEEIQQKKQFVDPMDPINYGMMTEGQALLNLLVHKLKVLGIMQDNMSMADRGIGLVRSALKSGQMPTGVISDELQPIMQRVKDYLSMSNPATGHGIRGAKLDFLKFKADQAEAQACLRNKNGAGKMTQSQLEAIGSMSISECMAATQWFYEQSGDGSTANPWVYSPPPLGSQACFTNFVPLWNQPQFAEKIFFRYGRDTDFRTGWDQGKNDFVTILTGFVSQYPNAMQDVGGFNYIFANQSVYDACIEELDQKMPTLSNWLNDLYRADNTRPDGTVGSGLYYSFIPFVSSISGPVTLNDFPPIVQTKMVMQQQYIGSCVNFTSISENIVMDLCETGFMFDTGAVTPGEFLAAQLGEFNPSLRGLPVAVILAIIAAVSSAVAVIPSIIAAANGNASDIDSAAADTSNFKTQDDSTLPDEFDFLKRRDNGGGGGGGGGNNNEDESGSNNGLLIAIAIAAAYAATRNQGKKKKKNK